MATAVAVLLALTACGGGSSSPTQPLTPAAPQNPSTPQAKTAKLVVSFKLPKSPATKSKKAHAKDITATVTQLDIMYANSGLSTDPATDHFFPLPLPLVTGSPCTTTATPDTFSCTIAVPAGSYPVQINTDNNAPGALGVTLAQSLTFSAGSTTSANFTITPIVNTVTSNIDSVRLPADGQGHVATITTTASDPDINLIVDPVVDGTVFGTIAITSLDTTDVSLAAGQTSFTDPGTTGLLTTLLSFKESEAATPFNTSFSIVPNYTQGTAGTFTFFAGTGTTPSPIAGAFPASPGDANTFVATIAQSGPATGGTGADDTYSGATTASVTGNATQNLTFGSFDTFSGFTVTEFNAGAQADGSTALSTINADTSNCTGVTVTPGTPTLTLEANEVTSDLATPFNITISNTTSTCIVNFTTSDWGALSLITQLNIVPPASLGATVNGHSRKAASIKK